MLGGGGGVWPGAVRVDMNQELVIVKMQKKVGGGGGRVLTSTTPNLQQSNI